MKDDKRCYGCKLLISKWYGDGTTIYKCKNHGGLVLGEDGLNSTEEDEPKPLGENCYQTI